jgi:palmitoyl-protein thioesterase
MKILLLLTVLCQILILTLAGKPVIYFHGLSGTPTSFDLTRQILLQRDPATLVFALAHYGRLDTLKPLAIQAMDLKAEIDKFRRQHKFNSFHLVCSSQGGLVGRAYIMNNDDHGVDTFMTLAAPNVGVYGIPDIAYLRELLGNITRDNAYLLLYTSVIQNRISFANMWNDPKHPREYIARNIFLPSYSNEIVHSNNAKFKTNFLKIKRFVVYGSDGDEVLTPWQTSMFGFYAESGNRILNMTDLPIYQKDTFGLLTLQREGRMTVIHEPGLGHWDWLKTESIIRKFIQYFD